MTQSRKTTAWLAGIVIGLLAPPDVGSAQEPPSPDTALVTDVTVDIWPEPSAPPRRYTLRCNPPHGTVPRPEVACARITAFVGPAMSGRPPGTAPPPPPATPEPMPPALRPPDGEWLCAQVYGGPAVARIRGLVGGIPVDGVIGRRDGCEIGSYDRNMELLGIP